MPEMKTFVGYEIVDAKAREELEGCVKSSDKTTGAYVYMRLNGEDKVIARKSVGNDNDELAGTIPTYSNKNQLTTGTPTTDYSCVNLKYFNENKGGGTKFYKHTISCGTGRFVISFPEQYQMPEQQIGLSGKSITFLSKKERPTNWQEYADIPYGMSTDWIDICQGMIYGQMENGELYGSIDKIGDYDIVWCGSTSIGGPSNYISGTSATIKLCIDVADAYTVDEL